MLEEKAEGGAIILVAGLYCDCDVVSNALVVVVLGIVLQDGKWVVGWCRVLVDKLQETDV